MADVNSLVVKLGSLIEEEGGFMTGDPLYCSCGAVFVCFSF